LETSNASLSYGDGAFFSIRILVSWLIAPIVPFAHGAIDLLAAPGHELKACEDMRDQLICAGVGVKVLDKRARPYGDGGAAIWVPDAQMISKPLQTYM